MTCVCNVWKSHKSSLRCLSSCQVPAVFRRLLSKTHWIYRSKAGQEQISGSRQHSSQCLVRFFHIVDSRSAQPRFCVRAFGIMPWGPSSRLVLGAARWPSRQRGITLTSVPSNILVGMEFTRVLRLNLFVTVRVFH